VELIEKEIERLFELSGQWIDKPKSQLNKEQQEYKEKYKMLGQMYDEMRMLNMPEIFEKDTEITRQVFVGTISDSPDLYFDCKDSKDRCYYINMKIEGKSYETYKDERLLKLSFKIWWDWFFYLRYIEEKKERIKKNQSTLVQVAVIDGIVRNFRWYKYYNFKSNKNK
jgi:hypothetical protein